MEIRLLDLIALLDAVMKKKSEHVDAERTFHDLRSILNKAVWVPRGPVESALFYAKECHEEGKWVHHDAHTPNGLIKTLNTKYMRYNPALGVFEDVV